MLVHHFLDVRARQAPQKTALVCGAERWTYAELEQASDRLACALRAAGIANGDRVATYLENSAELVIAFFGILKAGAICTLISPSTKADKLAYLLRNGRVAALISVNDPPRRRAVVDALPAASVPLVIWVGDTPDLGGTDAGRQLGWAELLATGSAAPALAPVGEDDLATIIYTSGTTGAPKGVMSAHRDMVFASRAIATYLANSADDVIFCALSLTFTYGLYQLLTAVLVGATLVLEKHFAFPSAALAIMARERVTGLPGVPTIFAVLLGARDLADYDLSSLRYVTNAAAPLPIQQIASLRAAFPRADFFSMYGQTECKRACYLPPGELDRRPGSVGLPLPGTEAIIVDPGGRPVPPGTVGELVLRGPHLMRGYWDDPEASAQRLRPGPRPGEAVLHTGDLFRMDAEGYLYFVGRQDDIIKCRGQKVSPDEIERALHDVPGVRDVAAIGVPDALLGEAIKVFVVAADWAGLTERDIRAHCARHLDAGLVPHYVEFRQSLPKSGNGKTVRKDLRACVA